MRKSPLLYAALGFMAGAVVPALADDTPVPPPAKPAATAPAHSTGCDESARQSHSSGMRHGGQQMHGGMMSDHQQGMQANPPQGQSGSMPGMPGMQGQPPKAQPSAQPGMKMEQCSGEGCKSGQPMQQMPMGHM